MTAKSIHFFLMISLSLFFTTAVSARDKFKKGTPINNKTQNTMLSPPQISSYDKRIFSATLWVDQIKAPITPGQVIFIDSLFALFKPKKSLSLQDVHTNVVLQIHDSASAGATKANIVEFDQNSGWMLAQLKKQEIVAPKQRLSHDQVVQLALREKIALDSERFVLLNALKRFESNSHIRGLAGESRFPEMLEKEMKVQGDKLTQMILKSQRKLSWAQNSSMPLPLVDTCERDLDLERHLKRTTAVKTEYTLKCTIFNHKERQPASLQPTYEVFTGVLKTDEPFLKVPKFTAEMDSFSQSLKDVHPHLQFSGGECIQKWITSKNLFAASCIERNQHFNGLYDGVHTLAYYHNQKMIYKFIFMRGFSDQNQKEIFAKMLNDMKGNVL